MSEHHLELRAPSLGATHQIAATIAGVVRAGDLVVLTGEMGSGKTAFAQGFGSALGVREPMTSPTFTLVHSHDVPDRRLTLHHADLYRLERTAEIADLSLVELAEDRGVVLVEWGEVAEQFLGDHLSVLLERDDDLDADGPDGGDPLQFGLDEARLVTLSAAGPTWAMRWAALGDALEAFRC